MKILKVFGKDAQSTQLLTRYRNRCLNGIPHHEVQMPHADFLRLLS